MEVTEGGKAPNFHMKTDNQGEIKFSDIKDKNIVLYFYNIETILLAIC